MYAALLLMPVILALSLVSQAVIEMGVVRIRSTAAVRQQFVGVALLHKLAE